MVFVVSYGVNIRESGNITEKLKLKSSPNESGGKRAIAKELWERQRRGILENVVIAVRQRKKK